ncbi:hypothetical protein ACLB2K_055766 [Fragaria x ananassa]
MFSQVYKGIKDSDKPSLIKQALMSSLANNGVASATASSTDELIVQSQLHVRNHILQLMNSMVLNCAIQLGIPDIIHNHAQPITLSDLTSALNVHPSKSRFLYRLMCILVQQGFFTKHNDVHHGIVYSLTPSSKLLLKDGLMTKFLLLLLDPLLTSPWHLLGTWFQNCASTPFEMAHGMSFFDLVAHEPVFGNMFNEAMVADSKLVSRAVVKECQGVFEGLKSLVDVGGGKGTMASAIADAFPQIKCTVLDLPHVIENLKGSNNLDFIGGNMFEQIPPANAILLKWILHDWNDEESVEILKRCRDAIPSKSDGGKVIIIEMVVTVDDDKKMNNKSTETQLFWDMLMMVCLTGRERTEKDWEKLFLAAGFSHYNITHTLGIRSFIEVYP